MVWPEFDRKRIYKTKSIYKVLEQQEWAKTQKAKEK